MKVLEGNPGKRHLPAREIQPAPIAPECPGWLHPYAKEEWARLAPKLERLGMLTELDEAAFAGYCEAYARWREASEFITRTKNGGVYQPNESNYLVQIPHVNIAFKSSTLMCVYLAKFGMSPSDRAGLVVDKQEDEDGMAALLNK